MTREKLEVVVHGNNVGPDNPDPHIGFHHIISDPSFGADGCCTRHGLPPEYHQVGDAFWVAVFRDGNALPSATLIYRNGLKVGDTLQINISRLSN
jgi:hypothetical protein